MTEAVSKVKILLVGVYDEYILKITLESRFILKNDEKMTEASALVCLVLSKALANRVRGDPSFTATLHFLLETFGVLN